MNIYFAGSIRGGREDKELYLHIITLLHTYGTVLTEHVGDQSLSTSGENMSSSDIYTRDMAWLNQADVVVAEVTTPSLGVGYEIGKAEGKPILCLFRPEKQVGLSAMIAGNKHCEVREYTDISDVQKILEEFFTLGQ